MSSVPSLSLPISLDRTTCQSSCNCCNGHSRTEQLSARVYAQGDELKAIRRPWWAKIFCCCWQEPPVAQKQEGIRRYRAHLYKIHGKNVVKQACSVCEVDLDDKIERRKSISLRELIKLEQAIESLEKFDLRYHRGSSYASKTPNESSGEEAIEEISTPDSSPPLSPKRRKEKI